MVTEPGFVSKRAKPTLFLGSEFDSKFYSLINRSLRILRIITSDFRSHFPTNPETKCTDEKTQSAEK